MYIYIKEEERKKQEFTEEELGQIKGNGHIPNLAKLVLDLANPESSYCLPVTGCTTPSIPEENYNV